MWRQAAVLRDFSQFLPTDGRPADDSTTVLVWYSPTAIYFGIRAYQDSAGVRATLADRDRITGDDYVEILLDTFNDRRQALRLRREPARRAGRRHAARRVAQTIIIMSSAVSRGPTPST